MLQITARAQEVRIADIHMDTCRQIPTRLLSDTTKKADKFFNPSRMARAAWHIAGHVKANLSYGFRSVWKCIKPKSPVVVLYKDSDGAFYLAEGADILTSAKAQGHKKILCHVRHGKAEDAIAHSLRNAVEYINAVKQTSIKGEAWSVKMTWGVSEVKQWAVRQALKVEALAKLSNIVLADLLGVSKESIRAQREIPSEQSAAEQYLDAFEYAKKLPKTDNSVFTLLEKFIGLPRWVAGALIFNPAKLGLA